MKVDRETLLAVRRRIRAGRRLSEIAIELNLPIEQVRAIDADPNYQPLVPRLPVASGPATTTPEPLSKEARQARTRWRAREASEAAKLRLARQRRQDRQGVAQ